MKLPLAVAIASLSVLALTTPLLSGGERVSAASWAAVTAGGGHTCALTASGGVQCWGANDVGQLGDGTTTDRTAPVDVSGLTSGVVAVAAGFSHTCALTTSGGLTCWGDNSFGQLGDGTTTQRTTPVNVSGLGSGVAAVAAGGFHTCALTTAGGVKCWGDNFFGQLGNGSTSQRTTPVNVSGLSSGAAAVTAGFGHTCALTTAAGVRCWGLNFYGQLGDGTTTQQTTPVGVVGLSAGVTEVSAGSWHTCALTTAANVECWGDNASGRLGDGTTTNRASPVDVSGLSGVAAVAAGGSHTCALTGAGGVLCWGQNDAGQLGDGTTWDSYLPLGVFGLESDAAAIAAGGAHTCALMTAGGLKCWGANLLGQLGDGTTTSRTVPVDVWVDSDRDGCTDTQELGPDPRLGGQRDPLSFWDFFDTPDASNVRDRAIAAPDIFRVVARFGSTGDPTGDPLAPPPPTGYHTAFDRGGPTGPNVWNQGPANGSVSTADIVAVVGQFGHTCA